MVVAPLAVGSLEIADSACERTASAVGAGAAQQHRRGRVGLGGQREQQVLGRDLGVAVDTGELGRSRERLPCPDRELIVRCHVQNLV